MRNFSREYIWLIFIILLGIFLRFYKLGNIPPGLYLDEILYGLDAFSIINTGRDIYGRFLPLAFQSSGYYPPLYIYILAPILLIIKLSAFSVRLPSAIFGSLTLIIFYLLVSKLVGKKPFVAIMSTAIMAFSPWHIHLSRTAFLASLGFSFLIFSIYLFLVGLRNRYIFFASSIMFALTTHSHYGFRLIAPVIYFVLFALHWKALKLKPASVFAIGLLWIITIASHIAAHKYYNANFRVSELSTNSFFGIFKEYLSSFSYDFLFQNGEAYILNNPWGKGLIPLILFPFLIVGLWKLKGLPRNSLVTILVILFIVPIPSAIAGLGFHAIRNASMLIPLFIIISLGVNTFLKKSFRIKLIISFAILIFFIETGVYLKYYFFDLNNDQGYIWGNNNREAIQYGIDNIEKYDSIIFSDNYNTSLSFFAFQNSTPSDQLQKAILFPVNYNGYPAKKINNFYFLSTEQANVKFSDDFSQGRVLLIDPLFFFEDPAFHIVNEKGKDVFQYKLF